MLPANPERLYLASTSPARLATLRAVGVEPIVVPSEVDEEAAVEAAEAAAGGPLTAIETVALLARLKAEAVIGRDVSKLPGASLPGATLPGATLPGATLPGATLPGGEPIDGFIVGCDSAFELDGVTYGKPHKPEIARARWHLQRGREGHLHSGHWVIDHRGGVAAASVGGVSTSAVRFASDITDAEIDAYVATGEPLHVAGAFTIDSLGAPFITEVRGDPHAVVGLSVALVRELVGSFGVSWPSFWNRS